MEVGLRWDHGQGCVSVIAGTVSDCVAESSRAALEEELPWANWPGAPWATPSQGSGQGLRKLYYVPARFKSDLKSRNEAEQPGRICISAGANRTSRPVKADQAPRAEALNCKFVQKSVKFVWMTKSVRSEPTMSKVWCRKQPSRTKSICLIFLTFFDTFKYAQSLVMLAF
jgi:hypothetical protein